MRWPIPLLLASVIALPSTLAQSSARHTLTVEVTDIAHGRGEIRVGLYNSADDFLHIEDAYRVVEADADRGTVTLTIEGIAPGTYAIALYHDEDGDGALGHNLMHLPNEGTGLSNNVRPRFGPPRFNRAAFDVTADTTLSIRVRY